VPRKKGRLIASPLILSSAQPFVAIGAGGGALPLPTKHPAKLSETTTSANATANFFILPPRSVGLVNKKFAFSASHNFMGRSSAQKPQWMTKSRVARSSALM
jgi:hypothetical protein